MISTITAIAGKDLRLTFTRGGGLMQSLLLGLLLIFVFSLSRESSQATAPQEAATIFWLSTLFSQILIFHYLHSLERDARDGLISSGAPLQGIWLGKALAGFVCLILIQCVLFPATIVFLGQQIDMAWLLPVCIGTVDVGICFPGAFMGAIPGERESLLSIVLFPLLVPLLLAGISLLAISFGAFPRNGISGWLSLACAFDLVYLGAGLLLFGFLYRGEN